jgi:hypothetical protein
VTEDLRKEIESLKWDSYHSPTMVKVISHLLDRIEEIERNIAKIQARTWDFTMFTKSKD